jgi:hypothetical protein
MVAKRDIKEGEVILREKPCIVGPKMTSQATCLGCLKTIFPSNTGDFYKCSKCTWPMCGKNCETLPDHIGECKIMNEKKFTSSINNTGKPKLEAAYCVIAPLRVILQRKCNPEK